QRQRGFTRRKFQAVCHCDLILLLCCLLPLRMSALSSLSYQPAAPGRLFAFASLFVSFARRA
ncbi:hypothetical protein ACHWI2_40450, partial [Klebsiella pneumoniae]